MPVQVAFQHLWPCVATSVDADERICPNIVQLQRQASLLCPDCDLLYYGACMGQYHQCLSWSSHYICFAMHPGPDMSPCSAYEDSHALHSHLAAGA